jgi:hypothetical protein
MNFEIHLAVAVHVALQEVNHEAERASEPARVMGSCPHPSPPKGKIEGSEIFDVDGKFLRPLSRGLSNWFCTAFLVNGA